jgi:PadR family transcriptional regulator, regulatory protein AphA
MTQLSSTAYVILGMLTGGPKSGYEVKALVDNSTRFFWAASYGQIYPELKRLAEAGLAVGSDSPTGGRRRTVYEITADGEEALKEWLRRPPEAFEMRDEGLLKLFFAEALEPAEAVEILRAMRLRREEVNRTLRGLEQAKTEGAVTGADGPPCYPMLVLAGGIEFTDWFADWCRRMEERIAATVPVEARR